MSQRLARDGRLAGEAIGEAHLVDIVAPEPLEAPFPVDSRSLRHRRLLCRRRNWPAGRPDSDLPPRFRRVGRGGGGLRQGLRDQSRRNAARCSKRSGAKMRYPAALYRPRLVFTSSIAVFGAPFPDGDRRRFHARAADELRNPEGDLRVAARRLFSARLFRRDRPPAADDLRSARRAEQGRVRILSRGSSASRWRARRRSFRSATTCATGTPRPAPRSNSFCGRPKSTPSLLGARRTLTLPGVSVDRRRADRRFAAGRGREGGEADPPGAGRDDRAHRRRLAARVRRGPRQGSRVFARDGFFRHHSSLYRRRFRR